MACEVYYDGTVYVVQEVRIGVELLNWDFFELGTGFTKVRGQKIIQLGIILNRAREVLECGEDFVDRAGCRSVSDLCQFCSLLKKAMN